MMKLDRRNKAPKAQVEVLEQNTSCSRPSRRNHGGYCALYPTSRWRLVAW